MFWRWHRPKRPSHDKVRLGFDSRRRARLRDCGFGFLFLGRRTRRHTKNEGRDTDRGGDWGFYFHSYLIGLVTGLSGGTSLCKTNLQFFCSLPRPCAHFSLLCRCSPPPVTRNFSPPRKFASARSFRFRAISPSWNCRRAGLREISGDRLPAQRAKRSRSCSSAPGIAKPVPIFRTRRSGSTAQLAGGSIEFDLTDQNWEVHGHATNPAFDGTVLHVFVASGARAFFSRTTANRNVPQVRVDPATLPSAFSTKLPLARLGRCHAPLRGLPEEKIGSILAAAAQFRLQRKTLRLQRLSELHGDDEALFQELAGTLGYKQNKLPFTLLAQRLPRQNLRAQPNEIEAILFGVGRISRYAGSGAVRARHAPVSARPLGSMVAAPRRPGAAHSPAADLALERDASAQSSATPPRGPRRHRGLLAEAGAFVRRKRSRPGRGNSFSA